MESESYQGNPEYWLPLKVIEGYAEQAVKLGRKVWNGRSILPGAYDKLPLEWLADDKQFINASQKAAGINFHIICNCVEGRISAFGSTDSLEVPFASPTMKKVAIEQQLLPSDKHLIRRIIVYPCNTQDYEQFERLGKRIDEAFTALENAMKKENMQKAVDRLIEAARMRNGSRAIALTKIIQPQDNPSGIFIA